MKRRKNYTSMKINFNGKDWNVIITRYSNNRKGILLGDIPITINLEKEKIGENEVIIRDDEKDENYKGIFKTLINAGIIKDTGKFAIVDFRRYTKRFPIGEIKDNIAR